MSALQVSRLVRLEVVGAMQAVLNPALQAACSQFGAPLYQINFAGDPAGPQNYYQGNRQLEELQLHQEPDVPALTWWTGEGQDQKRQNSRTFSGSVMAYWRYFLAVKGLRTSGLIELREATEAAMLAVLALEFGSIAYKGDLSWLPLKEQVWVDQDQQHVGFVQEVEYSATFEVNV